LLGGKWKEVKTCFSFSPHWPPSIGIFHWPLSNGTFHWPPSNGTFQGPPSHETFHLPPSWDLPSPPSFSFFLKRWVRIINGSFFFGHNFLFEFWKYLFLQPSFGREEWLVLVNGGKRESGLDVGSIFDRMEMSRDSVGSLKF
jgi:hypothetical protein